MTDREMSRAVLEAMNHPNPKIGYRLLRKAEERYRRELRDQNARTVRAEKRDWQRYATA